MHESKHMEGVRATHPPSCPVHPELGALPVRLAWREHHACSRQRSLVWQGSQQSLHCAQHASRPCLRRQRDAQSTVVPGRTFRHQPADLFGDVQARAHEHEHASYCQQHLLQDQLQHRGQGSGTDPAISQDDQRGCFRCSSTLSSSFSRTSCSKGAGIGH